MGGTRFAGVGGWVRWHGSLVGWVCGGGGFGCVEGAREAEGEERGGNTLLC